MARLRSGLLCLVPLTIVVACSSGDGGSSGRDPGLDAGTDPGADGSVTPADGAIGTTDSATDGAATDGGSDAAGKCGAGGAVLCGVGEPCATADDCEGLCTASKCAAPTSTDGKRSPSLGETGIDCGGAVAPKCADALACAADSDCASNVCSTTKKCVAGLSCKGGPNGTSGIETCGTSEAATDSCCKSLPLPVRTTRRLDRYEITSGRLRAFIDAVAAAKGGVPNIREWASQYAAAHPGTQLASVMSGYPGLLDILPDRAGAAAALPLPVHLGAFPLDSINSLDGCYVGDGSYGHPTYWQPPADLKPYGIGKPDANGVPDGVRRYSRAELDKKAVNCVMPLMLAAFCAWDGGELARTNDFREVWGIRPTVVGTTTVYIPWAALLNVGQFNWRNGHGLACSPAGWPGCTNPQGQHTIFPVLNASGGAFNASLDDSPVTAAPGRFSLDVTGIKSANGEGWHDVGGNMMDSAWTNGGANPGAGQVVDVCDASATPGPGETGCVRSGTPGVLRYSGQLPHIALVGYSFESHARRSERYLRDATDNEALIAAGDLKPVHFQYGKVGGRCARPSP
jgi:hypothetical protein